MIVKAEGIKRLIPQREPFMMVDEFERLDDNSASAALTVTRGNYFMLPDGTMSETGLIEHIAQSCSALAASRANTDSAPIGMIVEVKNFVCQRRPQLGEQLRSSVAFGFSFGNMTLAHGKSEIGGEAIVELDLKIYMQ